MDKEILNALLDYIDKKAEYDYASREEDEEGYTSNPVSERKLMESIKNKLYNMVERDEFLKGAIFITNARCGCKISMEFTRDLKKPVKNVKIEELCEYHQHNMST